MNPDPRAPRVLALIGMRAAGKTTVGRALAGALERSFIDLDEELARRAGRTAAGPLLAEVGEQRFRELETAALRGVLTEPVVPLVLATGGGAVVRAANRELLAAHAHCVWLNASAAVLRARLLADDALQPGQRPALGGGDPAAELDQLAEQRRDLYAQLAHLRIDVDALDVPAVVQRIEDGWRRPRTT